MDRAGRSFFLDMDHSVLGERVWNAGKGLLRASWFSASDEIGRGSQGAELPLLTTVHFVTIDRRRYILLSYKIDSDERPYRERP